MAKQTWICEICNTPCDTEEQSLECEKYHQKIESELEVVRYAWEQHRDFETLESDKKDHFYKGSRFPSYIILETQNKKIHYSIHLEFDKKQ